MDHNERHKKYNCNNRSEGLVPKITRGKKQNLFGIHVQKKYSKIYLHTPTCNTDMSQKLHQDLFGEEVKCTFNVINY